MCLVACRCRVPGCILANRSAFDKAVRSNPDRIDTPKVLDRFRGRSPAVPRTVCIWGPANLNDICIRRVSRSNPDWIGNRTRKRVRNKTCPSNRDRRSIRSSRYTFRVDTLARPRICRIVRHRNPVYNDIPLVFGNSLEGDRNPCGKLVHHTDLQSILASILLHQLRRKHSANLGVGMPVFHMLAFSILEHIWARRRIRWVAQRPLRPR